MTLALIAIIVTIVLCIYSNGKAQASKPKTHKTKEERIYDEVYENLLEFLDSDYTIGRSLKCAFSTFGARTYDLAPLNPSVKILEIGNQKQPETYKQYKLDYTKFGDPIPKRYKEKICDGYFRLLYDVVKIYAWKKHNPDKPISEANSVKMSEEEVAAAHKFFLDNFPEYMSTRYWIDDPRLRNEVKIHHVVSHGHFGQDDDSYEAFPLGKANELKVKYLKTGEYDDEDAQRCPSSYDVRDGSFSLNEDHSEDKVTFPIFPDLPIFSQCPILPPNPPKELFSEKKTALNRLVDYAAVTRTHDYSIDFCDIPWVAERVTYELLKEEGLSPVEKKDEETWRKPRGGKSLNSRFDLISLSNSKYYPSYNRLHKYYASKT